MTSMDGKRTRYIVGEGLNGWVDTWFSEQWNL